ncbi:T-cell immunoglobulin and mucin domain-containing protein 4 [Pseudochaenichthys georgianus]|uniref:T-cell immunoglobulin and mucin domain-containing protein 4 n=1 Tax=Pseudochaenichthys georgianus TaxID=52239 RepID=UPI00146D16DB|nr:T-cell immunoglobulin and mucin domain-containing protein 4 [Pseudochaenichthys georgianus]
MAAVSPPVFVLFLVVLSGTSCFKVWEGGVASLTCQYSVRRLGRSRVCWGRSCGTFWCRDLLLQSDENGVVSKVSERYRLSGAVLDGQMDLDILDVQRTDSGPYCCRVDIHGLFNDKKVIMNLRVVKAPVTTSPTTTTTTTTGTSQVTTVNWRSLLSSQLDLLRRNSTSDPDAFTSETRVPVVSLSVVLLVVFASIFLFLAFRRGVHRRAFSGGCFSEEEEPPHIIYEIRLRRPLQENVYTLD